LKLHLGSSKRDQRQTLAGAWQANPDAPSLEALRREERSF
jgi:hypothetical protein